MHSFIHSFIQQWNLLDTETIRNEIEYPCCPGVIFPDVTFHLYLQRKTLFYMINLILPMVLITLLAIITFILPADAGERYLFPRGLT